MDYDLCRYPSDKTLDGCASVKHIWTLEGKSEEEHAAQGRTRFGSRYTWVCGEEVVELAACIPDSAQELADVGV